MENLSWNGCWEKRDGRYICRWMAVWSEYAAMTCGCIAGYSGGGAFQMEKFTFNGQSFVLSCDSDFGSGIPAAAISLAECCQDLIESFHQKKPWYDLETLLLKRGKDKELEKRADLLYGGSEMPDVFGVLFDKVGLITKP